VIAGFAYDDLTARSTPRYQGTACSVQEFMNE